MKEIPLTQGKVTLVDDADYEWLSQWEWYCDHGYAARTVYTDEGRQYIRMHNVIMNPPPGLVVDHINRNQSDNRRCNLRNCTHQQNNLNRRADSIGTSTFKGVSWVKKRRRWRADITINKTQRFLGYFTSEADAAHAYDQEARTLFGEFAYLNFQPA